MIAKSPIQHVSQKASLGSLMPFRSKKPALACAHLLSASYFLGLSKIWSLKLGEEKRERK